MTALITQPTIKPARKVNFAALGGFIATMLVAVLSATEMPFIDRLLDYPGVETAIGGLLATGFAYLAREKG